MEWLNADQVAVRLGVARCTALELMHTMPHSVISGTVRKRIRVSDENLNAWMESHTAGGSTVSPRAGTAKGSKKKLRRR